MLSGYPPFPGNDHKEIIKNVMKKDLTFHHDEFKAVTEDCKSFIRKFLKKDPNERIKLEDAVKDVWFESSEEIKVDMNAQKTLVNKMSAYKKTNLFTKAIKMCMSKIQEKGGLENLRERFEEVDENKNGILERDEFTNLMKKFGFNESEIDIMMTALDLNNDGSIEYSEFVSGCTQFDKANMQVAAELVFNIIDKDNSGKMDFEEFKKFFTSQNIKFDTTQVENIFREMDEDQDGQVDVGEFSKKFKLYFE